MKNRRNTRLALGVAAALGVGLIGWAGTAEADDQFVDPHYYSDYDLDHDGVIDHFERDLMHYDRDGDGRLDPIERADLERHLAYMMDQRTVGPYGTPYAGRYYDGLRTRRYVRGRWIHPLDRNRDGVISRWEQRRAYRGPVVRSYHPLDRDGNGVIEPWERGGRRGGSVYFRW